MYDSVTRVVIKLSIAADEEEFEVDRAARICRDNVESARRIFLLYVSGFIPDAQRHQTASRCEMKFSAVTRYGGPRKRLGCRYDDENFKRIIPLRGRRVT